VRDPDRETGIARMTHIRPGTAADRPAMLAIINDAAQAYRGVIPPDRWREPYMPRDELEQEIAAGVVFWVAEQDGRLAGVMGIQDKGDVALVRHAYVAPALQRSGVGTKLLRHVEGLAGKPVLLGTWAAASWAIGFYRRNGYTVVAGDEKDRLLRTYWSIPPRQVETSVVMADARWSEAKRATARGDAGRRQDAHDAKIVAISVGGPREVTWRGRKVQTSIFKTPVPHRVRVARDNVEGDRQSDLSVHGGAEKAVYAYPAEHYGFWRRELPGEALPWGSFGENVTTEGLLEHDVFVGDRLRIGTAELVVTQPRMPCYKLARRIGRADIVKRFRESGRSGF
jgi:N-acetylglutamate synthase-like GNAT family acetyltransferase